MKAYVLIKIRTGEIPEVTRRLREAKGVVKASAVFGPYDAVLEIDAPDLNAIARIVAWEVQTVPGVLDSLTCLEMEGV